MRRYFKIYWYHHRFTLTVRSSGFRGCRVQCNGHWNMWCWCCTLWNVLCLRKSGYARSVEWLDWSCENASERLRETDGENRMCYGQSKDFEEFWLALTRSVILKDAGCFLWGSNVYIHNENRKLQVNFNDKMIWRMTESTRINMSEKKWKEGSWATQYQNYLKKRQKSWTFWTL